MPEKSAAKPRWLRLVTLANVVTAQLNTLIVTAGSFVVTPAVLYGLGDAAYGGWLLINSFIGYTRMLDLGVSSGTVKYGAGAIEREAKDDLRRVMNTSLMMFLALASVTTLACFILSLILPQVYANVIPNAAQTILILGGAMTLDLAFRPFAAALRMRSLYFVYDGIEIVTNCIFKIGLLLYFAHRKRLDYHTLALITLGETLTRLVFVAVAAFFMNPGVRRMNPFRFERDMVRKLATMGAAVSIIQIADLVRFQCDAAVIGYMLPENAEGIAIFGLGTRLTSIAYFVIGVIGSVLMPRFSGLDETADKAGTIELLRKSNVITGLLAGFVLLNIAVLGPHFLELWLRKPWVHQSGRILLVMVPAYYVASLTQPSMAMIFGKGKLRGLTILTVVEALVNFAASAALARPLGLLGVAIGTAVPLAFFRGIVFPRLLEGQIGLKTSAYYRHFVPALVVGAIYFVLIGWISLIQFSSFKTFFVVAIVNTVVFVGLAAAIVPEWREALQKKLKRKAKVKDRPSPTPAHSPDAASQPAPES